MAGTTVGKAREAYFTANGFSTVAHEDRWVRVRLFGIPIVFPNSSIWLAS